MNKKRLSFLLIVLLALSMFAFFIPQTHGSGSIDQGLVGYWRFDEGTGTTAADSSGNGNNGTLMGSPLPSWVAGKYGYALSFNGINDGVEIPDASSLHFGTSTDFTFAFWVKAPVPTGDGASIVETRSGNAEFNLYSASNTLRYWLKDTAGNLACFYSSKTVFDNTWHFVAVTSVRTGSATIYVDGMADTTVNISGIGDITTNAPWFLGIYNNLIQYPFNGIIDEFRIYNRALSATEISTLYTGFPVTVTYDVGSTITPNGSVNVGVDQSQSFSVGSETNFVQSTIYVDNIPTAPTTNYTFSGIQGNHTLYVTSQFSGVPDTATTGSTFATIVIGIFLILIIGLPAILLTRRNRR